MGFPSALIPAGEKKAARALRKWGVQDLPWLILTDDDQVVRAEGFAPAELDDKLKEIGEK